VAETLTMDYHREAKVDVRIARIFNTYGPRMCIDDGRVVSNFVAQVRLCSLGCIAVLYCTVLYCAVLYCAVMHCAVMYCAVLYCIGVYCTALFKSQVHVQLYGPGKGGPVCA